MVAKEGGPGTEVLEAEGPTDYKVLSKARSNRLMGVLENIVTVDQTVYTREIYEGQHIFNKRMIFVNILM